MKVNYSNKTFWRGIFIEIFLVILALLFIAVIARHNLFFLISSLLLVCLFLYIAYLIKDVHKKLYLDVSMEDMTIYGIKGNLKHRILFSDIKQLNMIKTDIYVTMKTGEEIKVNLRVISPRDLKQFIHYLQYNPKISNKNFHM